MVAASPWIAQLRHLRQFKPARLWGIGVAAGLVALGVQAVGGWRTLDYAGYKMLFHLRQAIAPLEWDPRIAVIAIDDRTLERYGQFPISRQYYTELLNRLLVSPPAAIGFDLLFVDPSPHDETLAAAMDRHWTVALPLAASPQGRLLQPVPPLKAAAAAHGHVMITADSDGVTRAVARYQGDVSTFGAALVQLYYESQRAVVGGDLATGAAAEASDKRPATPPSPSPLWVNWPGPVSTPQGCRPPEPEQLPIYPLDCILLGRTAPDTFNGRIVLVGVTATGIDPLRTPFNSAVPASNVYLHAAVIDNLLNGRPLRRPPGWLLVPLVAGMTLLALALQRSRLRPAAFALPGIWLAVGLGALVGQVWLPLAAPIAASLLAILGAQLNAQWENQQLKSLLAIHLDPTAASLLWQQRDRILNQGELPAQEAIATVMFIDIRGFTAVAEALPPQRLMRWLNQYLDAITQEITNRGGTVDKFVGDEVMAYFRLPPAEADPTALSQQALLAIETGLAVHERIQQLNQQLQRAGRDTIAVGIGIHTGPVSIGSMGSRHRLNYSMVGDTVNVAARLEELNKVVVTGNPFSLLLSEATYRAIGPRPLGDRFSYAPVGTFQLRGRTQPVCVYTVLPTPVYPTAQPAIIS